MPRKCHDGKLLLIVLRESKSVVLSKPINFQPSCVGVEFGGNRFWKQESIGGVCVKDFRQPEIAIFR